MPPTPASPIPADGGPDAAGAAPRAASVVGDGAAGSVPAGATPADLASAFERHWGRLWTVAAGVLGRRDGVEDVLQDAVTVAIGRLDDFEPGTSWSAWLSRIVHFTAMNHGRRAVRRRAMGGDALMSVAGSAAGCRPARGTDGCGRLAPDQEAFDDTVADALRALEPVARACLLLRALEGLSFRDIARALDLNENTAMSHVRRARIHMRGRLTPAGEAGGPDRAAAPSSNSTKRPGGDR